MTEKEGYSVYRNGNNVRVRFVDRNGRRMMVDLELDDARRLFVDGAWATRATHTWMFWRRLWRRRRATGWR